ncbi:MAG: ADP-forming succinate--CoA ligase subunit beta [archaeon]
MKLKEFQGKQLFKEFGISVPKSFLVEKNFNETLVKEKALSLGKQVVLKAQVLTGGRGKAGGVKVIESQKVIESLKKMLDSEIKGFKIEQVLVEEKINLEKEFYLSLTIDRDEKNLVFIASSKGGVNIEETAEKEPEKIVKLKVGKNLEENILEEISSKLKLPEIKEIAESLHKIFFGLDASLLEINPLVFDGKKLIAADAKVLFDDNALFRHQELLKFKNVEEETEIERKAKEFGLAFVELTGNVGVIGCGAGLVMASLDVLKYYGVNPANFLDVGGGASKEKTIQALETVLMKKELKAVFVNIFGGITRCDDIAQGIVEFKEKNELKVPLIVRLIGTNDVIGKQVLEENNVGCFDSMEECARKVKEIIG